MECLNHPDRRRMAQRSGVAVTSRSTPFAAGGALPAGPVRGRSSPLHGDVHAGDPGHRPPNTDLGGRRPVTDGHDATTGFPTAAPITSVSQLTPNSSFGGDIVRIQAGPGGGDFGSGVYAISPRARGETTRRRRRDQPAGRDLSRRSGHGQVERLLRPEHGPQPARARRQHHAAANSVGTATGLVNWYNIAFDPEGYFDGKPSMFVASVDRSDPNKNVIYRIAPDGTFMGAFVQFTDGLVGAEVQHQPDGDPGPAAPGPVVPARA